MVRHHCCVPKCAEHVSCYTGPSFAMHCSHNEQQRQQQQMQEGIVGRF